MRPAAIHPSSERPASASAWLTVDLGALAANYNIFRALAGPQTQVAGVIKADGYGLGVAQVYAALENQGCPFYFVATLDEALYLRTLTRKPVAVLGGLYRGAEDVYIHENIVPVLNALADIELWHAAAARHGVRLPAIIHFDTGMNRLGLGADETARLHQEPERLAGLTILYAMTHFACADEINHKLTQDQYERFKAATAPFPAIRKSLANSSGAFRSKDYHYDLLRPGMALYGLNPTPETANPMHPVVTLDARILQVRNVRERETVGYSATYRFDKNTLIATVALGYADGFLRSLSSRPERTASLYYNGTACPIIGRVSMDAVSIDVGHLATLPQPGESVEVLGPHQDADTLAAAAGTIGYEILTDLGKRYHRIYV